MVIPEQRKRTVCLLHPEKPSGVLCCAVTCWLHGLRKCHCLASLAIHCPSPCRHLSLPDALSRTKGRQSKCSVTARTRPGKQTEQHGTVQAVREERWRRQLVARQRDTLTWESWGCSHFVHVRPQHCLGRPRALHISSPSLAASPGADSYKERG